MSTTTVLRTAEDLLGLSVPGKRFEMLDGEVIEMAPAGARHGKVAMKVGARLSIHVEQNDLGEVFAAETGFVLARDPDTVRAPDVAFVAHDRLPPGDLPAGFMEAAPDLVVEVVSPGDSAGYVRAKVEQWLQSGVRLVWVVYPETRSVAAYRSLNDVRVLTENDMLAGAPVVMGFSCPVKDLF